MLNKSFRKPKVGDKVLCYGRMEGVVVEEGPNMFKGLSEDQLKVELERDSRTWIETVRKEEAEII